MMIMGNFAGSIIFLCLLQHYACVNLVTTEENNDAKLDCTSSAKSVYTVASEMQCHHRCLRKENCEILNYKVTGTGKKDNCEVFNVESGNNHCTKTSKANWKAVVMKRGEKREIKVPESCDDIKTDNPQASTGVYDLKTGKHYCIMNDTKSCGSGGWTLAMTLDGTKDTFSASSSYYWENNSTYNVENGLKSSDTEEAKFPAFNSISFKQICLGMNTNGELKWVRFRKNAASLLQVFKGRVYQPTTFGRHFWTFWGNGVNLQPHCNKEGFNLAGNLYFHLKIGILGNNEDDCNSPDSFVGFGSSFPINCGTQTNPAFGYIYIQ